MAIDFGKQIGPLPLGAWIAIVAGGLGIAWYTRQGGPGDPTDEPTDVTDTSGDPGVGTGAVGGWQPTVPPTDGSVAPNTKPTTNEEWAQMVINGLIAMNYSPTLVDSAIRKYIAATGDLSVSEWTVLQLALARYGAPPVALPPTGQNPPTNTPGPHIPTTPLPGVKPAKPNPAFTYYTVRKGDDLFAIAWRLYKNPLKWNIVYSANRKGVRRLDGSAGVLTGPSNLTTGQKLVIPKSSFYITG